MGTLLLPFRILLFQLIPLYTFAIYSLFMLTNQTYSYTIGCPSGLAFAMPFPLGYAYGLWCAYVSPSYLIISALFPVYFCHCLPLQTLVIY